MDESLFERLAAIEHERWSDWQRYMHSRGERLPDGSLRIPAECVERWERQIATPYQSLTEHERNADRKQVRRYWHIVQQRFDQIYHERNALISVLSAIYPTTIHQIKSGKDDPAHDFVVSVDTPIGKISWFISGKDARLFQTPIQDQQQGGEDHSMTPRERTDAIKRLASYLRDMP